MSIRTPQVNSKIMSHIKGKDTQIELKLRKALWAKGLRYRKNMRGIPGTPDICFPKKKVAIFCDSEFWHGQGYYCKNNQFHDDQSDYWNKKIQRNIERDLQVNAKLEQLDWKVLRFWAKEINFQIENVVSEITEEIL
jgi:DNA mismatch endonuclease, patch repair protein